MTRTIIDRSGWDNPATAISTSRRILIPSFLHLTKDETVAIVARSALVDTALAIWDPTAEAWAEDDDSGGGLLGQDARIVFQAPKTGEYVLFVQDASWTSPGGYVLSVKRVEETDRTTSLVSTRNARALGSGVVDSQPVGDPDWRHARSLRGTVSRLACG